MMKFNFRKGIKSSWDFLKKDTWQSWIISLVLAFLFIKFIFFPFLSFVFLTDLPLVVVESCSMYHAENFDSYWNSNGEWYESKRGIDKEDFEDFSFKNGLNKGDIVLVSGRGGYEIGDIIIFDNTRYRFPLIHRLVRDDPYATKGDNGRTNPSQLPSEVDIPFESIKGKAIGKVPGLGWIKLIFFEGTRASSQRGFCK